MRLVTSVSSIGIGCLVAITLGSFAACGSNDSSTHGFVATGDGSTSSGDDSGIGVPVVTGDDGSTSDDATVGDQDSGSGDDQDASSGNEDASTGDDGSTGIVDAGQDSGTDSATGGFSCDGVISAGEYGTGAMGQYSYTGGTTAQVWYMSWDASNLYIGISNADVTEASVIYVGESSLAAGGLTSGFSTYNGTDPSSLPFAANFVVFAKKSYSEFRLANGGMWSSTSQLNPAIQVCANASTTVREIVVPWTVVGTTGTLPASFQFLGYMAAASGYVYGQIPSNNPGDSTDAGTASWTHYFSVTSTATGGSTPFSNPQ